MTFDPVLGDYLGPVHIDDPASPATLRLLNGTGSASATSLGGMVSILQGAGAGQ